MSPQNRNIFCYLKIVVKISYYIELFNMYSDCTLKPVTHPTNLFYKLQVNKFPRQLKKKSIDGKIQKICNP